MQNERVRVLIVDDHRVVRQGLRDFLELHAVIEVVGEAGGGAEGVALVRELVPDVVLMDLMMAGVDGITATRQIRQISPRTQVIVLTSFTDDQSIFRAMQAGGDLVSAQGCVARRPCPRDPCSTTRRGCAASGGGGTGNAGDAACWSGAGAESSWGAFD